MDAIEEKIEAIKSLFVPFDLEVEIRIGSNTATYSNGKIDKFFDCCVVYVDDDLDDLSIYFVATENTKKLNVRNDVFDTYTTDKHLLNALSKLYNACFDAIERKYDVQVRG